MGAVLKNLPEYSRNWLHNFSQWGGEAGGEGGGALKADF